MHTKADAVVNRILVNAVKTFQLFTIQEKFYDLISTENRILGFKATH